MPHIGHFSQSRIQLWKCYGEDQVQWVPINLLKVYWLWRISSILKFFFWLISLANNSHCFTVVYAACVAIKSRGTLSCCVSSINYRKHWTSSLFIEGFYQWYWGVEDQSRRSVIASGISEIRLSRLGEFWNIF